MDVAVVGAGPGGAWAARTLATRGARVVVIDPSHPREKPCGGGVTGRALALVSAALQGHSFPASVIRTARFVDSASRRSGSVALAADPPGYIWSFPRPTHLAVGICAQADAGITSGALRARALSWIEANGLAPGAQLEPYSWPIPSLEPDDFEELVVSGRDWFL